MRFTVVCLTLIASLAACAPSVTPGSAEGQAAAGGPGESRCLREAASVKSDYVRYLGGDDIRYHFAARTERARELCLQGRTREAMGLLAAVKADIRAARKERWEDVGPS